MDYYQLLGVRRDCDVPTLRKAFRDLSKTRHPDRFSESERANAEKNYQQIVIAFNTLKDPKLRGAYDRRLTRTGGQAQRTTEDPTVMVRKYYKSGVTRMSNGQYQEAVDCFKRAIHYQQDPEFYFQKGLAESKIPKLKKDAVASFQRAIELKPQNPKYHLQMVTALHEFGLATRAKVYLEKALERFPQNDELQQLAMAIDPKKYKKNIFGNLFGR